MTMHQAIAEGYPMTSGRPGREPTWRREGLRSGDAGAEGAPASLRVLVVEDNLVNQLLAAASLSLGGYEVEVASNGREAVDAVENGAFDLILMDIEMPIMNGIEATRAIRSMPGPQRDVWIIAVTSSDLGRSKMRCRALAFDDAVLKPYNPDMLLEAVVWVDENRPRHNQSL